VKTVCEREDTAFIFVSCVDRSFSPHWISASTSSLEVTVTIDAALGVLVYLTVCYESEPQNGKIDALRLWSSFPPFS